MIITDNSTHHTKMGADVSFSDGKRTFSFRDSYNNTNLACSICLSYWRYHKKPNAEKIKFFERMAEITNDQLETWVNRIFEEKRDEIREGETEKQWLKMFIGKRNSIRENLDIIRNAKRIVWCV